MDDFPIIIHHECDDGEINDNLYLLECLEQTVEYNENVVLIGSQNWKPVLPTKVKFVDCKTLEGERWRKFEESYVDLAPYYHGKSILFFRRLFLIYEYCKINSVKKFVLLDADVLVYINFVAYKEFLSCDFACCIDENQFFSEDDMEGLRWVANVGVSYWTIEALEACLDFCQEAYTTKLVELNKKYQYHLDNNIPGGVTEMSVIYLWVQNSPDMRFLNLAIEKNGEVFNSNIWKARNYYNDEYSIDVISDFKKISFDEEDKRPIFYLKDGTPVRGYNIHFGGQAKYYMREYRRYRGISKRSRIRMLKGFAMKQLLKRRLITKIYSFLH